MTRRGATHQGATPAGGVRRLFRLRRGVRSVERDVDDELRFHLEERAAELMADGMTVEAAREAAARVSRGKKERDARQAQAALRSLSEAAAGKGNVMGHIREAVRAYCTVGEIAAALKEQFGAYQPPTRF